MSRLTRILAPIGLALGGVGVAAAIVMAGRSADSTPPPPAPTAVEVVEIALTDRPTRVFATGTVAADRQVAVSPEVSGRIVEADPRLLPGGRFAEGEVLARVDARDYRLAVQQEEARVQQAELELQLESGRVEVARQEWAMLREEGAATPLALREPHLKAVEAGLESARSGLERAKLSLSRTALKAPFNAMVVTESVDVGQVVAPGQQLVTLVGTDRMRVTVAVPVEQLRVLDIPGVTGDVGSTATVSQRLGQGQAVERRGRVVSLGGQLDPQTRTAQVVVAIDDPLGGEGLPLLPGAFVDVVLEGRPIADAVAVPRVAVSGGDLTWIVDAENKLAPRPLTVAWREPEALLVVGGLKPGDRVVTTPLSLPIEGAPVTIAGVDEES
ncbi:MAG: efflux RND transporter periplasmic adaptor subunit [Alphaproteobacteria bacterium]|nr:efflux RND transporter periplasmic adaptor subunit [Alphaproteobacteria bacterium]